MSVMRSGSTQKYSEGWDAVFGKKKRAGSSKGTQAKKNVGKKRAKK